uniref:Zinc finger, CCHC-type n=1 Tax=Tanacetum cinerariifolium TaxID=118510 RepID=A0A699HT50_TANCI|nr:zinc finger, CCHC-type [Tanacetum cinerariifolium]
MSLNLALSLILVSLSKEYDNFVQNYNMHGIGKTVNELHTMLRLHEQTSPKKDVAPVLHKLKPGALNLYVGNGHRAAVEAIGTFHLCIPSGLVVIMNNCHYAPSINRGIISVYLLKDNGFVNCFIDNGISASKDGLLYFHAIPRDSIYEIDLHCANSNDSSIYVVSNKSAKLNLDYTLLWHYHLAHISKKRIEKL